VNQIIFKLHIHANTSSVSQRDALQLVLGLLDTNWLPAKSVVIMGGLWLQGSRSDGFNFWLTYPAFAITFAKYFYCFSQVFF